ncbi:hypothetical protein MYP_3288 [Sporocytophaga myxococcoides]|uniref:Uncharacterized protein n=1 Tax=Sporocytophaga myxococcoides TaxID=153721 RepID=A0A098LHY3_9BACT|nr:hypothetical protein [Sporocytophaga myxococcoides]GAL86059.1 hypothetical protein MYP_3288 [Sporocytophaga myxococcoides]
MEKLSKENEEKLKQSIELLSQINKIGVSSLSKFPNDHYELSVFTYICYLERFVFGLESIKILLIHYRSNPKVETSIGLITRTGLLDFMTIAFLNTYYSDIKSQDDIEGEKKYNDQINCLASDQIQNSLKYLNTAIENGILTKEHYKKGVIKLHSDYNFLFNNQELDFDEPWKNLIDKNFITPKQLFTRINSHKLTKKYSKVYDLYTYYSKYEHFGIMTHFLQGRGMDIDLGNIIASLKYLILGIGIIYCHLNYPEKKLQKDVEEFSILQNNFWEL